MLPHVLLLGVLIVKQAVCILHTLNVLVVVNNLERRKGRAEFRRLSKLEPCQCCRTPRKANYSDPSGFRTLKRTSFLSPSQRIY